MSSNVDFIGQEPLTVVEKVYTPTANQTTWNEVYVPGRVMVYLNGIKLIGGGVDFTASNGTTIVLTAGADTSDRIEFTLFDMGACA